MICRWVDSQSPRVLDSGEPCPYQHCIHCGRDHVDELVCAGCINGAILDIREILRMAEEIPEEAEAKGVDSEAMNLAGPVADPEARGHMKASVLVGRVPADYYEEADSERHPLFVLGRLEMLARDLLEEPETERVTVTLAGGYLIESAPRWAQHEDGDFSAWALDISQCRSHLEAALHDGEQRETGAPCVDCSRLLVRTWGPDGWHCDGCRTWLSESDYRGVVAALHLERAEWLTDKEMEARLGIRAATVRKWGCDERRWIRRKQEFQRVVFSVADAAQVGQERGIIP